MDGESQEEEEIELEDRDINLVLEISALHSQVGRDSLVDGPGKLIVQFPGAAGQENGADCQNDRYGDQERLGIGPDVLADEIIFGQLEDGVSDLIHLNGAVDEKTAVVHDQPNDLNGIFHAQGIPYEQQLIEKAKNVQGEEGRDCSR